MKKQLPAAAKMYFIFVAVSIAIVAVIAAIFSRCSVFTLLAGSVITFFTAYIPLAAVIMFLFSSAYDRIRNLIVFLVPALLSGFGLVAAIWFCGFCGSEYGDGFIRDSTLNMIIAISALATPVSCLFLEKTMAMKAGKLYLFGLEQIIVSFGIVYFIL